MWSTEASIAATFQDLKYGFRTFTKSGGFTAVAVLTLALGIGASTAVFSLVDAILLKPLPYPHAEQIVLPWRSAPPGISRGYNEVPWDRASFLLFSQETQTFAQLGAFVADSFNLTGSGEPVRLECLRVSAGFFPALGVAPLIGRFFKLEEDQAGRDHEVVLSYQVWQDRFGGDPHIVGQATALNGAPYTVVGVMPPGFAFPRSNEMPGSFRFPRQPEVWVPIALTPGGIIRGEPSELAVVGRLKEGFTISQSQAELNIFAIRAEELFKAKGWFFTHVVSLARQVAGDTQRPLLLLLGAVGVVLLIACCNVANLLLTRSLHRKREFTLRAALGAGNGRLVRQLLTESLLLASAGGAVGMVFAHAGIYFVKTFGPSNLPRLSDVGLDLRIFGFALGVTLITGIIFGLAPAIGAVRDNLAASLREGARGMSARPKLRDVLLVSEIALALVLAVAAVLLTRTFFHILGADGGFNATRVLTFELSLPSTKYTNADRITELYHVALDRLRAVPGIESAGITETLPMGGAGEGTVIRVPDHPVANNLDRPFVGYTIVSPGYFAAVGAPILRGRDFRESDIADSMPVTIINSTMAKRIWPGESALGRAVGLPIKKFNMTVVGIVADIKYHSLRETPQPEMYVPFTQNPWPSMLTMQIALRARGDPGAAVAYARQAIQSVDQDVPLANVRTLARIVDASMAQPRFSMLVLGAFASVAVLLAAVGIYGVVSFSVLHRTQEIGIRMALGAERSAVLGMILRQGARLAGLGIGSGLVIALSLTHLMASFLYGVQPTDPLTFVLVSLLLLAIAMVACYFPARRATRLDPIIALRNE